MNKLLRSIQRSIRLSYRRMTRSLKTAWGALAGVGSGSRDADYSDGPGVQAAPPVLSLGYPVFVVQQAGSFVIRFVESRQIIPLLQGVPALLCGLGFVLSAIFLKPGAQILLDRTDQRLKANLANSKLQDAEWHARRACQLDPENKNRTYTLATVFEELGREEDCRNIMVSLANENGFVPAIEWLCRSEFEKIQTNGSIDVSRDEQILHWLGIVLQRYPDKVEPNVLLGSLHLLRERYSSAIPALKTAVESSDVILPDVSFSLATAYQQVKELPQAVRHSERAAIGFAKKFTSQPANAELMVKLVRALVMSHQEERAIKIIREFPETQDLVSSLKQLQGGVYAAWSSRLREDLPMTNTKMAESVQRIYQGLTVAPSNREVLNQLARIVCTKEFNDAELEARLNVALDSGSSPGIIHFILGSRFLLAEAPDTDAAERHLKIASAHNSSMPGLMNNMAEAMMLESKPDFYKALGLIDEAIRLVPNQPYFYDTRGKAFLATGQYAEAIADFERALAVPELRPQVHLALSEAYAAIDDSKSAARHLFLANSIEPE